MSSGTLHMGIGSSMSLAYALFFLLAIAKGASWSAKYPFIQDSSTFRDGSSFDFIIVGGGTTGCPLAATLSHGASVLVLERGGAPFDNPSCQSVAAFPCNLGTSVAQPFQSRDGVISHRATVLGGASSINLGFYSRASADFVSSHGWDPPSVRSAYQWVEQRIVHDSPTPGPWQSALKGAMLAAGLGPDAGSTRDFVTGVKLGSTLFDSSGVRHSAAELLASGAPSRLQVLLHATVERVLFNTTAAPPSALGVSFSDSQGLSRRAFLRPGGEVLLSAGALGSPQLLLLSGVGPKHKLEPLGIPLVAERAYVGDLIADVPGNAVDVQSPSPVELSAVQFVAASSSGSIIEGISGGNHTTCFPRAAQINVVPPALRSFQQAGLAASILGLANGPVLRRLDNAGFIFSKVYRPSSRGTLWLASTRASDNPVVRFNYFSTPEDQAACFRGVQRLRAVVEARALAGYRYTSVPLRLYLIQPPLLLTPPGRFGGTVPLLPDTSNFTETAQWCKDTVTTVWHYFGGCQNGACVDGNYRLKGVRNLRVIDGSTWNSSPGSNPQGTCMMLGRYMGVKILQERGVKASDIP